MQPNGVNSEYAWRFGIPGDGPCAGPGAVFLSGTRMASSRRNSVFRAAALERLSSPEQLDERMQVVSPRGWLALAALGALLLAVVLWGCLGRIAVEVHARGQFTAADPAGGAPAVVAFFGPRDVRRIEPGMKVRLLPVTYSKNEDGFIAGIVKEVAGRPQTAVSSSPATPSSPDAAMFEVRIAAPSTAVPAGMPCTVSILIAEERPIALVLPSVAGLFRR